MSVMVNPKKFFFWRVKAGPLEKKLLFLKLKQKHPEKNVTTKDQKEAVMFKIFSPEQINMLV